MIQYEGVINGKDISEYNKKVRKAKKDNPDDFFAGFCIPVVHSIFGIKTAPLKSITAFKSYTKYEAGNKRFKVLHNPMPILHPLSDLTKPIEHNGEVFVPIKKIKELFIDGTEDVLSQSIEAIEYFIENNFFSRIEYLPFVLIKKLIEWHFAVGLSEDNYIDVNSLKESPYK